MAPHKTGSMPIEERAKRFLASYSKHGGKRRAKSFRKVGEREQCQIASQILGETLTAARDGVYYLKCPGVAFHTGKDGRRDCRFTPGDGGFNKRTAAPSLCCMHQSCGAVIEEMNRKIRSEIGKAAVEYITDHGSVLNNAAAHLVIGMDIAPETAQKLLVEWGKTCTPVHTALACGRAVAAAEEAYKKHPDEVGYLLKQASAARTTSGRGASNTPPNPQLIKNTSLASASNETAPPVAPASGPIYLGAKGKIAQQARTMIECYRDDHGIDPTTVLLGPDQPEVSGLICGLPVERMRTHGISVHG